MQQSIHYSVSFTAASCSTVAAPQPNITRISTADTPLSETGSTHLTEHHVRTAVASTSSASIPAATTPAQNGFRAIKEAARSDFFTIRADSVQDAVLSSLDTLAEYLVWDGMDRRLRAVASATHTEYPEAVVSIQQIANDIRIRVGHDLCERTIERALKKLCDVGLLSATARFHQGRRQASSYMLLYAPTMASRLENSRRGRIRKSTIVDDPQHDNTAIKHEQDAQQYRFHASVRIGDMISVLPVFAGYPDARQEDMRQESAINANILPDSDVSGFQQPTDMVAASSISNEDVHGITALPDQNNDLDDKKSILTGCEIQKKAGVCRSAHQTHTSAIPGEIHLTLNHPTSVSPLFNKKEKENKNVFSISDFVKKEPLRKTIPDKHTQNDDGYYLDTVHRSGWISSPKKHLLGHLGSLSTYLFFNKYRTIETMVEWFQQQENRINCGEITLDEILLMTGISPEWSQYEGKKTMPPLYPPVLHA